MGKNGKNVTKLRRKGQNKFSFLSDIL